MKTIAGILSIAVLTAAIAGCGGPWRMKPADNKVMNSERIVAVDSKVASYLGVRTEVKPKRVAGDALEVSVVLFNKKGSDLSCDVKWQFLNEDGAIKDETGWQPVIFAARTETPLNTNSLSPDVSDYRLSIRLKR